jgi:hypothetical protein
VQRLRHRGHRVPACVGDRLAVLPQEAFKNLQTLNGAALQRYFAADPESWAARLYLSAETMSIG